MFENLPSLIWVHLVATVIALPLGLQQLLAAKGNARHRLGGQVYIVAMLTALLSALATFRPDTLFLPFHILAFVGLGSLIAGTLALRRWLRDRNPVDLKRHKTSMAFSWLGLAMAGVSQITSNPRFGIAQQMTPTEFWIVLAVLNLAMYALGSWWVFARLVRD
ncbi:MAG: DUF2306 domain-containing protein [Polymorphobacter sp.]